MKKLFILTALCLILLTGCGKKNAELPPQENGGTQAANASAVNTAEDTFIPPSGGVIEIKEKMFIAQTNDIYINVEDYAGKTLKYEGLFKSFYMDDDENVPYCFVIRYGPGCCGYDGEAGFEVTWNGELPNEDDWCEAVGVLETYEQEGAVYLRLALTSLTVLDVRGKEYVNQ